jgi:hypothetical protein
LILTLRSGTRSQCVVFKMPTTKRTIEERKVAKSTQAADFYKECLLILNRLGLPYMVGGTFALHAYTGIQRQTKDLDIFTKASDYPRVANALVEKGFKVVVVDERWLAKVWCGKYFVDIIFSGSNAVSPVTDGWFKESRKEKIMGISVAVLPPTESVWSKMFIENRTRYDGNDLAHMILKYGKKLDWKRLLSYADQYWEILLVHVLRFRFIYPSEREVIPRWLLEELLSRLQHQMNLPTSQTKVCRGRLLSTEDFVIDVAEWGFVDIVGMEGEKSS